MDIASKIPQNVRTIAATCLQFGDTGKGKIIDLLASLWADIIVRPTGGGNAGHTVVINGKTYTLHLVPSGILHDKDGKVNIVGGGVAVDPRILCEELALLTKQGLPYNHLMVALNAKLTLPTQVVRDRIGEGSAGAGKIGTTGRGIGPTYGDHTIRVGLTVNDLLNRDILATKVRANVAFSVRVLRSYDPEKVKAILQHEDLGSGMFYHPEQMFDVDVIVQKYLEYATILGPLIRDTDTYVQERVGKSKIALEGAQGSLLDLDRGTYPFVTSSNCTVDGAAKGAGLTRAHIDLAWGVFKGFYETRVGRGPFPTEHGGKDSDDWCNREDPRTTREVEEQQLPCANINDADAFHQGVAIRRAGNEYGATTKRPRRVGWLDLPLLRWALRWGSHDVVITKLDVLDGCDTIRVCNSYVYRGQSYYYGDRRLNSGDRLDTAIPAAEVLGNCHPIYTDFFGWKKSIRGITAFSDLPRELRTILGYVVSKTGIRPKIISTGPDRQETIFV